MRASREEWRRRVARWQRSGMTARAFASASGVNAGTLRHWKYRLGREQRGAPAARSTGSSLGWPFVEVVGTSVADGRFEVELGRGRRVRVPASFDVAALRRLVSVLEEATGP